MLVRRCERALLKRLDGCGGGVGGGDDVVDDSASILEIAEQYSRHSSVPLFAVALEFVLFNLLEASFILDSHFQVARSVPSGLGKFLTTTGLPDQGMALPAGWPPGCGDPHRSCGGPRTGARGRHRACGRLRGEERGPVESVGPRNVKN